MSRTVNIEYPVELESGEEVILDVQATIPRYVPARIHPVDESHPAEGGTIEDLTFSLRGKVLDKKDLLAMGVNIEKVEERVYEAHAEDADEGLDADEFDDPFEDRDY